MRASERADRTVHEYYPGMHAGEVSTDLKRDAKEEKMREGNLQPYPISVKCTCYIDGFKRILEFVEMIKNKQLRKDGRPPTITRGMLKDVARYIEFINNITGEETHEDIKILSSLIDKTALYTEDLNMLSYIANKNIILLEQIAVEEKEKEGKSK